MDKAKRGRPTVNDPRNKLVTVRVTEGEREALNLLSKEEGKTVGAILRELALKRAKALGIELVDA